MSVYFAQVGKTDALIKIGFSDRPVSRLRPISNHFGEPVTLLAVMDGGYNEESAMHDKFAKDIVWLQIELFHNSRALRALIKKHKCKPIMHKPRSGMKSKLPKKYEWDAKAAEKHLADLKH